MFKNVNLLSHRHCYMLHFTFFCINTHLILAWPFFSKPENGNRAYQTSRDDRNIAFVFPRQSAYELLRYKKTQRQISKIRCVKKYCSYIFTNEFEFLYIKLCVLKMCVNKFSFNHLLIKTFLYKSV